MNRRRAGGGNPPALLNFGHHGRHFDDALQRLLNAVRTRC